MKDNLIKKVIQERTIEATKKNINTKLICIARNYGHPIIGHYYDSFLSNEDWDDFNDPTKDWSEEDDSGTLPKLGYIYDSLRIGKNIEIVVMAREEIDPLTGEKGLEKPTKVKCSYNGYTVYEEQEGRLVCYAPFNQWETIIDNIYKQAVGADKLRKDNEKEKDNIIRKKATKSVLSTLRKLWGI